MKRLQITIINQLILLFWSKILHKAIKLIWLKDLLVKFSFLVKAKLRLFSLFNFLC